MRQILFGRLCKEPDSIQCGRRGATRRPGQVVGAFCAAGWWGMSKEPKDTPDESARNPDLHKTTDEQLGDKIMHLRAMVDEPLLEMARRLGAQKGEKNQQTD